MLILQVLNQGVGSAQIEGSLYFPQTGHWVSGEFLELYQSVPEPEIIYGYPLTDGLSADRFVDPSGTTIQYFERARFELHPENPEGLRVKLSLLGEYFYDRDGPGIEVPVPANSSACRNIPQDGLPVCFAFLRYFDSQGGIAQFGYPISALVIMDGRLVQYFQRARFEWHPEKPSGERVLLSNLGVQYFYAIGESTVLTRPTDGDWVISDLLELRVNAFVDHSVIAPNRMQGVNVVVQDQTLRPVAGAQVVLHVTLPSGATQDYSMPLTNSNGVSALPFIVQNEPAGLVHIRVDVRTSELHVSTQTSFRIWK